MFSQGSVNVIVSGEFFNTTNTTSELEATINNELSTGYINNDTNLPTQNIIVVVIADPEGTVLYISFFLK